MPELMELIKKRRSIRKYLHKDILEDHINAVIDSVKWAPSWANTQCWEIIVVKDPSIKKSLQATLPPKGNPAAKAIVEAPVLFALCGKLNTSGYYKEKVTTKFGDWFMYDLGIATQNLCLAAQELGLGTVIVGLFDHDKAKNILKVPDGYEIVTLIPMGYPAKISKAPKRKELSEFIHHDTF